MRCATPLLGPRLEVPERFEGPPGVGNGGYCSGVFAALVPGPARVTLRRPVPLARTLTTVPLGDRAATVGDEAGVIAEVESIDPLDSVEPPIRPSLAAARRHAALSPFRGERHPYPGCFVCGPEHPDGLGIHAGPIAGEGELCAGVLDPRPSLPRSGRALASEVVWAALDCPSFPAGRLGVGSPHLLGRLSAELLAPVPADRPSVVVGWTIAAEGRKLHSACAVLSARGELLARSRALWIALERDRGPAFTDSRQGGQSSDGPHGAERGGGPDE